ncbi:MAG: FkbM family methyltransferase, partial [Oscillospiraceae bacterium]
MLEFIKEKQDVWEMMREKNLPIVMYGMGDGAIKIMKTLDKYGLKVSEFFASDEFVRGHSFMGYKVRKLSEIEQIYDDFIIIMAFGIHDVPMTNRIHEIAKKHVLVAPDVPVAGENLFTLEFVDKNKEKIQWVYDNLEDSQSKKAFSDIINFKISGKISYLSSCETEIDEAYENILNLGEDEVFADLGAYHGETIDEFLEHSGGKYNRIIAFEP